MKKAGLLFVCTILLLSASITHGQIKVSTAGKVKIGATTDASYPLDVVGDSYILGRVGIQCQPSTTYSLYVSGTTKLAGNVGIGKVPSPSYNLYTGSAYVSGSTS